VGFCRLAPASVSAVQRRRRGFWRARGRRASCGGDFSVHWRATGPPQPWGRADRKVGCRKSHWQKRSANLSNLSNLLGEGRVEGARAAPVWATAPEASGSPARASLAPKRLKRLGRFAKSLRRNGFSHANLRPNLARKQPRLAPVKDTPRAVSIVRFRAAGPILLPLIVPMQLGPHPLCEE
jgi:hypothetical protein